MIGNISIYKNIIISVIAVAISLVFYFYVLGLKDNISDLKSEIKDLTTEIAYAKLESSRYKNSLDSQNREISLLKSNEKLSLDKLKKWKSKPAKVKYKTIYKIREIKSNECSDIKSAIDSVRNTDFSSL